MQDKSARRPVLVTAAAVVLVLLSVLNVGLAAYITTELETIDARDRSSAVFSMVITLAIGLAQLFAALRTLSMKEQGRRIGALVATLGAALALAALLQGAVQQLLGLALNSFVLYALSRERRAFSA